MHAERSRNIAGGGDDAAPPSADDHRLVHQLGAVSLLDRGVERIAIDVGGCQAEQLGMSDEPWSAAIRTSLLPAIVSQRRQTITAEALEADARCGLPIRLNDHAANLRETLAAISRSVNVPTGFGNDLCFLKGARAIIRSAQEDQKERPIRGLRRTAASCQKRS
jgi:hypothetical protein